MNATFDEHYRKLGRATLTVLVITLLSFGLTLLCAFVGLPQAVTSFRGATASLAYAFAVLFVLRFVASVVVAIMRWSDRRNQIKDGSAQA